MEDEILTFNQIKKLKVAELKARLGKLGLHVSGLKADLVARLASYYESLPVKRDEEKDITGAESNDNATSSTAAETSESEPPSETDAKAVIPQPHFAPKISVTTSQLPETIDVDEVIIVPKPEANDETSNIVLPLLSEMVSSINSQMFPLQPDIEISQPSTQTPDTVVLDHPPIYEPHELDTVDYHPPIHGQLKTSIKPEHPLTQQPPELYVIPDSPPIDEPPMMEPSSTPQPDTEPLQELPDSTIMVPDIKPEHDHKMIELVQPEAESVQQVSEPVELDDEPVEQLSELVEQDISEPVQQDDEPIELVSEPVEQVSEPVEQVSEPVEQVFEPVKQVSEPVELVPEPVQQDDEFVEQVFEPVEQVPEPVKQPVQQYDQPMEQVAKPVQRDDKSFEQISEAVQQEVPEPVQQISEPVEQVVTGIVSQIESRSEVKYELDNAHSPLSETEPQRTMIEPDFADVPAEEKDERDSVQDDMDVAMDDMEMSVEKSPDFEQETAEPSEVHIESLAPVEQESRQEPERTVPKSPVKEVTQDSVNIPSAILSASHPGTEGEDSGYHGEREDDIVVPHVPQEAPKRKKKKKRRKKRRESEKMHHIVDDDQADEGVEIEYVPEELDAKDPVYAQFAKIFEAFKLSEKVEELKKDDSKEKKDAQAAAEAKKNMDADDDMDTDSDEEEIAKKQEEAGDKVEKLSKKKLKLQNRMSVAELKQHVSRPDVVEMHDVTAPDPKLLVYLKACRNTVPVPRHWCFKRKFLQGKRGIIKPPFQLPEFIQKTGIMEMREALQEKEDAKNMKAKMREKVRPKMGKIDIDYQKLHDAFFKFQTKPKMSLHGDLYYEGKEFETKLKEKKPGDLSEDLRTALGMPTGQGSNLVPPPWLIAMQRYGPPPSYPNLKIPGLNAPIPEGASFGYHAGGWGKPPVDEQGRPLYGDVFGLQQPDGNILDDEQVDATLWGELESESEESEESEEESEEEPADQSGLVTPAETGLVTPSGLTSIPAGMETPDMIELRKRKNIEEAMESGAEQQTLYTVLPEKRAGVGAVMMGSSHVYDLAATAVPAGTKKTPGGLSEGVEVALDPSELELDPAAMQARYDEQLREQQNVQKEDFSDMVAEHAARQQKKRKKTTDSGKAAKKYKEFKF